MNNDFHIDEKVKVLMADFGKICKNDFELTKKMVLRCISHARNENDTLSNRWGFWDKVEKKVVKLKEEKKKFFTMFVFEGRNANGRKIGEYMVSGMDVKEARKKLKSANPKVKKAKMICWTPA